MRGDTNPGDGPEAGRRGTVFAVFARSVPHHFAVDRAADAVVKLGVQLRQRVPYRPYDTV